MQDQEFAMSVMSVLAASAVVAPLVKILYDPSKQYICIKRRTIQHTKRNELRVLVCIHNQDNVPTIVNLLEISNATVESPVAVVVMILVELVGRTSPILVAHKPQRALEPSSSRSGHILNAIRRYEHQNEGKVTLESYTAVSHFETMHDDICQVARDKRATIVIVPFHKQWAIDGSIGSEKRAVRMMNLNVLNKAPCSVGILIDRGTLSGSLSVLNNRSLYRVVVLFIGGSDDVESLAYGARMVEHERVNLTVIRFLQFGGDNTRERKLDSNLIDEYRLVNAGNERFMYREAVVRDGVGLAALVRGIQDSYDLMIVGRHHAESPLLVGLDQWSECTELGVIGDMLASKDFGRTASVLVVQQQRVGGTLLSRKVQLMGNDRDPLVHDVPNDPEALNGYDAAWSTARGLAAK